MDATTTFTSSWPRACLACSTGSATSSALKYCAECGCRICGEGPSFDRATELSPNTVWFECDQCRAFHAHVNCMKAFQMDRCPHCSSAFPPHASPDSASVQGATGVGPLTLIPSGDPTATQVQQIARDLAADGFLSALFAAHYSVPFHTVHVNGLRAFEEPMMSEPELMLELGRRKQQQQPMDERKVTQPVSAVTAQFATEVLKFTKDSARPLPALPRTRLMLTLDEAHPLKFVHPTYSKELHEDEVGLRISQSTQTTGTTDPTAFSAAGVPLIRSRKEEISQVLGSELTAILTRHKKVDWLAPEPGVPSRSKQRTLQPNGEQSQVNNESGSEGEGGDAAVAVGSEDVWLGTFPDSHLNAEVEEPSDRSRSPEEDDLLNNDQQESQAPTLTKPGRFGSIGSRLSGPGRRTEKEKSVKVANSRKRKRDDGAVERKRPIGKRSEGNGNVSKRDSLRKKSKPRDDDVDTDEEERESVEEDEEVEEGLLGTNSHSNLTAEAPPPPPPPPPPPAPHQFYQERQQRIARNQERLRQLEILRTGGK